MRTLLILTIIVNVGLFAFGRGYFGNPPSEAGRAPVQAAPINSELISLGEPSLDPQRAP